MVRESYRFLGVGGQDIVSALQRISLVGVLGWVDVKQRYRRSALGPFWITVSMGVMIATIGLVFGRIFQSSLDEFLPYLTIGMVLWMFISSTLTEGCLAFINAESVIKQLPIPLFVHVMRVIWRNTIILAHNLVIVPIVFFIFGKTLSLDVLLSVAGFFLLVLNLGWVTLALALFCARYRDMPQIVASLLQVAFYLTPIIWMASMLPAGIRGFYLDFNPLYHLVEIVRAPMLSMEVDINSWLACTIMVLVGWSFSIALYNRCKCKIAYWV